MPKIKYLGASQVREVTRENLEHEDVYDHEDKFVYIDTRTGDDRARIADVSDSVAALLTGREPEDWVLLSAEEEAIIQQEDKAKADAEAASAAAVAAARAEVEENQRRARAGIVTDDEE
jgi:hypothetical protein